MYNHPILSPCFITLYPHMISAHVLSFWIRTFVLSPCITPCIITMIQHPCIISLDQQPVVSTCVITPYINPILEPCIITLYHYLCIINLNLNQHPIAKLSFNFNFNFNLVESWDGFILHSSTPPTHPWKSSELAYLSASTLSLTPYRPGNLNCIKIATRLHLDCILKLDQQIKS